MSLCDPTMSERARGTERTSNLRAGRDGTETSGGEEGERPIGGFTEEESAVVSLVLIMQMMMIFHTIVGKKHEEKCSCGPTSTELYFLNIFLVHFLHLIS